MYDKLFSPVRIGRVEIKNRAAMPAMGVNLAAPDGGVNDDIIAFYEARARGGVGLIISGVCRVMDGAGASEACQLAARNGADLQGLERLMDAAPLRSKWQPSTPGTSSGRTRKSRGMPGRRGCAFRRTSTTGRCEGSRSKRSKGSISIGRKPSDRPPGSQA